MDEVNKFQPDGQLIGVWYIRRGATFRKHYAWKTGPKEGPHTPVDLTGWTARGLVRDKADPATILIDLTEVGKASITLEGATGGILIEIEAETATLIASKKGLFDIELVNGTFVKNFTGGEVIFLGEQTHA